MLWSWTAVASRRCCTSNGHCRENDGKMMMNQWVLIISLFSNRSSLRYFEFLWYFAIWSAMIRKKIRNDPPDVRFPGHRDTRCHDMVNSPTRIWTNGQTYSTRRAAPSWLRTVIGAALCPMPLGAPGISSGQVRVMGIKNGRQEIAGSSLSQGVSFWSESLFLIRLHPTWKNPLNCREIWRDMERCVSAVCNQWWSGPLETCGPPMVALWATCWPPSNGHRRTCRSLAVGPIQTCWRCTGGAMWHMCWVEKSEVCCSPWTWISMKCQPIFQFFQTPQSLCMLTKHHAWKIQEDFCVSPQVGCQHGPGGAGDPGTNNIQHPGIMLRSSGTMWYWWYESCTSDVNPTMMPWCHCENFWWPKWCPHYGAIHPLLNASAFFGVPDFIGWSIGVATCTHQVWSEATNPTIHGRGHQVGLYQPTFLKPLIYTFIPYQPWVLFIVTPQI